MLRPLNILGLVFDMLEQFCSVLMGEANGRHGQLPEAFITACLRCSECAKSCIEVEEVSAKTFTFYGGCKFVQFDIHQLQLTLESMHLVVDFNFFISLIQFCLGKNSVNSCERVS